MALSYQPSGRMSAGGEGVNGSTSKIEDRDAVSNGTIWPFLGVHGSTSKIEDRNAVSNGTIWPLLGVHGSTSKIEDGDTVSNGTWPFRRRHTIARYADYRTMGFKQPSLYL